MLTTKRVLPGSLSTVTVPAWASTTAVYTHVGADAKNRMLRAALDGVMRGQQDGDP